MQKLLKSAKLELSSLAKIMEKNLKNEQFWNNLFYLQHICNFTVLGWSTSKNLISKAQMQKFRA